MSAVERHAAGAVLLGEPPIRKLDPEHARYVVNCWGIGYRLLETGDAAGGPHGTHAMTRTERTTSC